MSIELLNMDCMDYMAGLSDNAFSLACVDPPYGIGQHIGHSNTQHTVKEAWDNKTPSVKYWEFLFNITRNQIVFGGNYFQLPSSRGWMVWDKTPMPPSFADCELIWTSFDKNIAMWKGKTGNSVSVINRIHPTQKPVALYTWIFQNYAKPGQSVIDTHLGSASSAIAAHYAGLDFVGCEIDEDYFKAGCKRFKEETRQLKLF